MPPNFPGPALFSLPTLNLMFGFMLFAQGILIFVSSWAIKDFKGVRAAALATFALSISYLIIGFSHRGEKAIIVPYIVQMLTICGYFLIHMGICKFIEKPCTKWLMLGFAPLSAVAMTFSVLFFPSMPPLKVISLVTGIVVFVYTAWLLFTNHSFRYKFSAVFTSVTLILFSITLLVHLVASFFSIDVILPTGSDTEKFTTVALFIASYLWTGGFILMVSQRLQSDLHDHAMKDSLTQVHNRRAMDQLLETEMKRTEKNVGNFSIILCDIDQFKHINDTYGHQIGDQVLQWFAATVQKNLRGQDVVARWGGEEFLILLPDTALDEAGQIAERLRKSIASKSIHISADPITVTFSAGVSSALFNRDVRILCKVADEALYVAKKTRNRVVNENQIPSAAAA